MNGRMDWAALLPLQDLLILHEIDCTFDNGPFVLVKGILRNFGDHKSFFKTLIFFQSFRSFRECPSTRFDF